MRKLLLLSLLLCVCAGFIPAAGAEQATASDLVRQAWQAERQENRSAALTAYASALALRPEDPQLNLKVAELLSFQKDAIIAPYLVRALDSLQKDKKCPVDLKIQICSALMGTIPPEWRAVGWGGDIATAPYTTLPEAERRRLAKEFPESWFFPSKRVEMFFRLSVNETDRAAALLKELAVLGDWRTIGCDLVTRGLTEVTRKGLAKDWIEEGKKTGNLSLRLGALHLYSRVPGLKEFKEEYVQVLQEAKGQPKLLPMLADACNSAGWADEAVRVKALYASPSDKNPELDDRLALEQLIKSGEREKTEVKLRQYLIDYPDSYYYVFSGTNLQKMVTHGWGDLLVQYLQPDWLEVVRGREHYLDILLIASSLFNQPRFDYWVKHLVGHYANDNALCQFVAVTTGSWPAEDRIWLFEQFGRMFAGNNTSLTGLAEAYLDAGYPNRALPILTQVLKQEPRLNAPSPVVALWTAAEKLDKLPETAQYLWDNRADFPPSAALAVARAYVGAKKPAEAQKWLDDLYSRAGKSNALTSRARYDLWSEMTYTFRLKVLVELGDKEKTQALLREAHKRYPECPFSQRVPGLNAASPAVPGQEMQRQSNIIKRLDSPGGSRIPCREIVNLADELLKSGRASEAQTAAENAFPINAQWRQGVPLAVAMLRDGVKAVVPFVDWLRSVSSDQQFARGQQGCCADQVIFELQRINQALMGAFSVAVALVAPEDSLSSAIDTGMTYGPPLKDEDMKLLVSALSPRKLNRASLVKICTKTDRNGTAGWQVDLASSQTWSVAGLIATLFVKRDTGSEQELRTLLDALSKEQDWTKATSHPLSPVASSLMRRGMTAEAEKVLALALKHAQEHERKDLTYSAASLSGLPPSGELAEDSTSWRSYAVYCRNKNRAEEAQPAALQALKFAKTPRERSEALSVLALVDPNAFAVIVAHFATFTEGKSECLRSVAELLFGLVKKDHKLAVQAAPLLEKALNCGNYNYTVECWPDVAATHIWAGKTDMAISIMLARLADDHGLRKAVTFICVTDMDPSARSSVEQALDKALQSSRAELSYIAGSIGGSGAWQGTDEGLISLASVLTRRIQSAEGIVPAAMLDLCINGFGSISYYGKRSQQVTVAWYQMTETAVRKAAANPDDAKAVADRLRKAVELLSARAVKDTDTIQRLTALADSLK